MNQRGQGKRRLQKQIATGVAQSSSASVAAMSLVEPPGDLGEESVTRWVSIDAISLPPQQPRRYFDSKKLEMLSLSIKEHGILEPLLVRPQPEESEQYELIAGERRWHAAKKAGLEQVPVVIKDLSNEDSLVLALIENLQREDLNPFEETEGVLQLLALKLSRSQSEVISLLQRMHKTKMIQVKQKQQPGNSPAQSEAAESDSIWANILFEEIEKTFQVLGTVGWQSFVTARLPLLNLPEEIRQAIQSGKIEYSKARLIGSIKDPKVRVALLEEAIELGLSQAQIRKRKRSLEQEDNPLPHTQALKSRVKGIYRSLSSPDSAAVWQRLDQDPSLLKRLDQLVTDLEALLLYKTNTIPDKRGRNTK